MKNQKYKLNIKNKKNILFIFGLSFLFFIFNFSFSYAQVKTLKNIGFVQENIWYSKDPFFDGDKIRIYTAVLNASKYDFKGILEFTVAGKSIGKSNFSLVSGAFQVLWADWVAESGNKKIYASITEAKISLPGGVEESVILENSKTGEIETFVDKDTDKDGIPNQLDKDDDGDNVSDSEEAQKGTNPLVQNVAATTTAEKKSKELEKQTIPELAEVGESAKGAIAVVNNFLDEQKEKAEIKKEEIQKKLGQEESLLKFNFLTKKNEVTQKNVSGENKDLLKLYALALSAVIFSLEYKVLIYLFGIYIVYRILKLFIKKLFFRRGVGN